MPEKSHNPGKINQRNTFFGSKIGLNYPLGPGKMVNRNSHIVYISTTHP